MQLYACPSPEGPNITLYEGTNATHLKHHLQPVRRRLLLKLYACQVFIRLRYTCAVVYMCPHTTICVLVLLHVCPICLRYTCAAVYMCPHTTICVTSCYCPCVLFASGIRAPQYVSSYVSSCYCLCVLFVSGIRAPRYVCVLTLLYMCPRATVCVSCLFAVYMFRYTCAAVYMCPRALIPEEKNIKKKTNSAR